MLEYLLKSGACLAIFLLFYQLFLERESMHVFKRYYLLAALVLSLTIPSIVFVEYVEVTTVPEVYTAPTQSAQAVNHNVTELATDKDMVNLPLLLWTIYGLGVILFGLKFFKNLRRIILRIRKNPKYRINTITNVLLKDSIAPHTFFRFIFLNKEKYEKKEIPRAVLLHEETHAKQKHSLDVLFVELLQVLFWFNPLIYLAKLSIKLNHEFLADQAVVNHGIATATYQNILLAFSSNAKTPQFSNSINYSSIKKRFTIMKTHTSKKAVLLRSLLLLPLLAILVLGFSETRLIEVSTPNSIISQEKASKEELAQYNKLAKKYNKQPKEIRVVPARDLKNLESVYQKMNEEQKANSQPFPECPTKGELQDSTSLKLIAEYNKLAKHYNEMPKSRMKIKIKDVKRLEYIYGLMSDAQKADAEPFPDFPEPPPLPKAPKAPEKLSEREEAAAIIEKIIEEQDPYDVVTTQSYSMLNSYPLNGFHTDLKKIENSQRAQIEKEEALLISQEKEIQANEKKLVAYEAKMKQHKIALEKEEMKLEKQENLLQAELKKLKEQEAKLQEMEESITVYIHNSESIDTDTINLSEEINYLVKKDAEFFYQDQKISTKEGLRLLESKDKFTIQTFPWTNKKPEIKIYEKKKVTVVLTPPIPPEPITPLDHIIKMAKKDAIFMYEGKEISSDKAIELMKKNKSINIDSRTANGKRPLVKLSTEPIQID